MNTRLHSLKVIMPLALIVMTGAGLASCGGGGGGGGTRPVPPGSDAQMMINPPRQQDQPDLVVALASVSHNSPAAGASFTLSAAVRNDGAADAGATTLRYYRSPDATITTADTAVGTDDVGALSASGTSAESISLTAPTTARSYYYGACVDPVPDESDTSNNCSAAVELTVEPSPDEPSPDEPSPDVVTLSVRLPNTMLSPGDTVWLEAVLHNPGDTESPVMNLRFYHSEDATITRSDRELKEVRSFVVLPGDMDTQTHRHLFPVPQELGTYYYGACLTPEADQSDATSNCSVAAKLTVGPRPDLTVSRIEPAFDLEGPRPGGSFRMFAEVLNRGGGPAEATKLEYFRSADSTTTISKEATVEVGALGAGDRSGHWVDLTAPSVTGSYSYWACVDLVPGERFIEDNCSVKLRIEVLLP